MLLERLLPCRGELGISGYEVDEGSGAITVEVVGKGHSSCCPLCGSESERVHSRYERRLKDLPLGEYAVELCWRAQKYFCDNANCQRKIYAERLPALVGERSRRTRRFEQRLIDLVLAVGGAGGERLSQKLGYRVSDSSLLYLLLQPPLPACQGVTALGVDDFAFRQGQQYGTILVDLEAGAVIDLRPDAEAGTLASWLKDQRSLKWLTRDRSTTYRQGMRAGAPEAQQVVDRFHLLPNLSEVLERSLRGHKETLKQVEREQREEAAQALKVEGAIEGGVLVVNEGVKPSVSNAKASAERRQERQRCYERVRRLKQRGRSLSAIARSVGKSVRTVQRWLQSEGYPERLPRRDRGRSKVDAYKPYLAERYGDGERSAKRLYEAIARQGYEGSYMTVVRYVRQLASATGSPVAVKRPGRRVPIIDLGIPRLTAKSVASWVMQVPPQREASVATVLRQLKQSASQASCAIRLAERLLQMVRQRTPGKLDLWLADAEASAIKPFVQFARGIREDYDAIKAGLSVALSNGPVEGQVNRLKMLKRQMYGRAGLGLLRRRMILA